MYAQSCEKIQQISNMFKSMVRVKIRIIWMKLKGFRAYGLNKTNFQITHEKVTQLVLEYSWQVKIRIRKNYLKHQTEYLWKQKKLSNCKYWHHEINIYSSYIYKKSNILRVVVFFKCFKRLKIWSNVLKLARSHI